MTNAIETPRRLRLRRRAARLSKEIEILGHMDWRLSAKSLACLSAVLGTLTLSLFAISEFAFGNTFTTFGPHLLLFIACIFGALAGRLAWHYPLTAMALVAYAGLVLILLAVFGDGADSLSNVFDFGLPSEEGREPDTKSRLRSRIQRAIAKRQRLLDRIDTDYLW